jgi:uncharacterized protein (UPF0264 family)
MSKLLVSVKNLRECELALHAGVDLIDLKAPQYGALGGLALEDIRSISALVAERATTSATIGDIAPDTSGIEDIVLATAACGVDFVKVAMLHVQHADSALSKLANLSTDIPLIAVLFAEDCYPQDMLQHIACAGFAGVMWDTREKNGLSLLDHISIKDLQSWVVQAQGLDLMTGLAGSLSLQMVPLLQPLSADYLGFRGGLCDNARDSDLSPSKLQQLLTIAKPQNADNWVFSPTTLTFAEHNA